ncbi:Non-specific lipid transfer protein GPI-anchored 10-like protein [Drosera capensis]
MSPSSVLYQLHYSAHFNTRTEEMTATCCIHPMILAFLFTFPILAFSQVPIDCGPRLLVLAPCLPFVRGSVTEPTLLCCGNLQLLYNQEPGCLCLLLNGTSPISIPVNATLALQLPALCHLQTDHSSCPGVSMPPMAQTSQASFGTNSSSVASASPMAVAMMAPRPSTLQFGILSAGHKMNYAGHLATVAAAANLLFLAYYPESATL